MGIEERKFPRLPLRLTTFVKYLSTGKVRRTLTQDLSAGGACLVTEELLEPGTQLELGIKLPDFDKPITCTVEVVRSQPTAAPRKSYEPVIAETSVKIVQIDPKSRALLLQFTTLNAPPPGS